MFYLPGQAESLVQGLPPETWLTPLEYARYSRFSVPKRAAEFALSRLAAKQLALSCAVIPDRMDFSRLEIEHDPAGAPFLRLLTGGAEYRNFSLSHSHGAVFCGLSFQAENPFGMDLEWIEPRQEDFLRDFFTAEELRAVKNQPLPRQPLAANLIWSAKEAVLKALRAGLRLDTRQVQIALSDLRPAPEKCWQFLSAGGPNGQRWQVAWQVRSGYVMTLAQPADHPFNWQETA